VASELVKDGDENTTKEFLKVLVDCTSGNYVETV